mmetsp:Transcript_3573/g.6334  ORF Transcript_3573/g.6334 Transcript_3573/m.6334 type:complete len:353 (-) Transcript_3573:8-1066(-)
MRSWQWGGQGRSSTGRSGGKVDGKNGNVGEKAWRRKGGNRAWQHKRSASPVRTPASQSTLKVADYSVSGNSPNWEEEAFRIYRRSGFVLVKDVLSEAQCREVLADCRGMAKEMVGPEELGNRGPGRYSFGVASSTGSILHVESIASHLLNHAGLLLQPLLQHIFSDGDRSGYTCYSGGGDFVLPHVEKYQQLHADIEVARRYDTDLPPPFLSVNFCIQDLTSLNGPMRIIPGMRGRDWDSWKGEPDEWLHSRLHPVPAGAALVRDVRILHGGTPNLSEETRFLPSLEFVSNAFRETGRKDMFPPFKSLPRQIFNGLHPQIQRLCRELVAELRRAQDHQDPATDARFATFSCR